MSEPTGPMSESTKGKMMLRRLTLTMMLVAMLIAVQGVAAADEADRYICEQDEERGIVTMDGSCMTPTRYSDEFSVAHLVAVGVAADPVDNGDGTTTLTMLDPIRHEPLARITIQTDPLERAHGPIAGPARAQETFVDDVERIWGFWLPSGDRVTAE